MLHGLSVTYGANDSIVISDIVLDLPLGDVGGRIPSIKALEEWVDCISVDRK